MCEGTKTTLACGHELWHITLQCADLRATGALCSQRKVHCRFINDTCADCDPGARRKMLQAWYEQQRAELVRQYSEAKKADDPVAMANLERQMIRGVSEMRTANFEISLARGDIEPVCTDLSITSSKVNRGGDTHSKWGRLVCKLHLEGIITSIVQSWMARWKHWDWLRIRIVWLKKSTTYLPTLGQVGTADHRYKSVFWKKIPI